METEREIAAPGFATEHPELHHYTNFDGLRGIVESNTLWATHFSCLNDSTEVMLLKQPMTQILTSRALKAVQTSDGANRRARRAMARAGNVPNVMEFTVSFVEAMFAAAFKGEVREPLAEPFITSFCAHSSNRSYERENGLLSQWRAYGGDKRYCIVFDTQGMISLLDLEFGRHYWTYMRLAEVCYAHADIAIETLFPELLDSSEEAVINVVKGGAPIKIRQETLVALLSAATRFKHEGFREEQEVRVIAIPGKDSLAEKMRVEHPDHEVAPLKQIRSRGLAGECPYIALFDHLPVKLPIKRIIVGPSRDQDKNLTQARWLLGRDAKLHGPRRLSLAERNSPQMSSTPVDANPFWMVPCYHDPPSAAQTAGLSRR